MLVLAVISLLLFLALGVPVSFGIAFSGLLAIFFGSDMPAFMTVQQMVRGLNSFPLMAAPFFILAGEIMGAAKLSERIINFCRSVVGWLTGGLGMVCVLANMIFAGISGSGAATLSAIGGLTAPELVKAGYKKPFVAALIAGAGSLGPIIPPSNNMIIYAALTGYSVGKIFIGGVVPGIFIGICLMVWSAFHARKYHIDQGSGSFSFGMVWTSFKKAFFALITPLIIVGGVISGVFTATEAGVVACVYGLLCGFCIYRTLTFNDLKKILRQATETTAMVMLIMGMASIYSYIFAIANVGQTISTFLLGISSDPTIIVSIIIGIMLIIGCFMETIAAMVVIIPIIYPLVVSLGVDPLMFGVLFSISTVIGALTPPVGLYLFLSVSLTEAPFTAVAKQILVPVLIVLASMIIMLLWSPFVTWLPNLLM